MQPVRHPPRHRRPEAPTIGRWRTLAATSRTRRPSRPRFDSSRGWLHAVARSIRRERGLRH